MRHDVAFFFFFLHSVVNVQVTHSKWSHLVDAKGDAEQSCSHITVTVIFRKTPNAKPKATRTNLLIRLSLLLHGAKIEQLFF